MNCIRCMGQGTTSTIHGHCTDIDGGRWHDIGSCCGGQCCPPCSDCQGTGEEPLRPIQTCLAHMQREPCQTCAAYIAAGL